MLEFVGNKGCHKYIYVMNNHLNWGSFIEGKVHNNSNNGSDEVKVKAIAITKQTANVQNFENNTTIFCWWANKREKFQY